MERIRVAIVDDHPLFRRGLTAALQQSRRIEVLWEAADGLSALEACRQMLPQVVLMDVRMRGMTGPDATRRLKREFPELRVIALSAIDDDESVEAMMEAGADGYLLKDADAPAVIASVEEALQGHSYLHPAVAGKLLRRFNALVRAQADRGDFDGLSEREIEVLRLVAQGKTNKETARLLVISERTVDNHVRNIYSKLRISDRSQAVLYAVRKGLISVASAS